MHGAIDDLYQKIARFSKLKLFFHHNYTCIHSTRLSMVLFFFRSLPKLLPLIGLESEAVDVRLVVTH